MELHRQVDGCVRNHREATEAWFRGSHAIVSGMLRHKPGYDSVVSNAQQAASDWPGKRLGLPDEGPRSIGRLGRRVGAIFIDWGLASLIAWAFFPRNNGGVDPWWTMAIFAGLQILFQIVLNATPGYLITGMRLVPVNPAPLGLWRPIVRTALLCVVIPAVIWDRDQRGLHDRVAGTILVRR